MFDKTERKKTQKQEEESRKPFKTLYKTNILLYISVVE